MHPDYCTMPTPTTPIPRTAEVILEEIAIILSTLDELEAELYLTQYPDENQTPF